MRKKWFVCVLTIVFIYGCSWHGNDDEILYPVEEIKTQTNEHGFQTQNDGHTMLNDSMQKTEYYGEVITFNDEENEFVELINSGDEKISVVLDMDCDGLNEAIVCLVSSSGRVSDLLGLEYDCDEYYVLEGMYFIDENKSIELIDRYKRGCYLTKSQYLLKRDNAEYVTLNGYMGVDSIGEVISLRHDELVFITDGVDYTGHKFFLDKDKLIWNSFNYDSTIVPVKGKPLIEGNKYGKSFYSYFYTIDDFDLKALNTEEKTSLEINNIAPIDLEKYKEYESIQFIYRENGELDVNYSTKYEYEDEYSEIVFNCDIYYLTNGIWEFERTINGYMKVNPMEESEWQYLYCNQE